MNKIIVVIGAIFSSVLFLIDCSLVNIKKEKIISKIYIFPKEIIKNSIRYYENNESSCLYPYIDQNKLEQSVNEYLSSIYKRNEINCVKYNYFIIQDDKALIDVGEYKKNCEITIIFNISTFYKFTFNKVFMVNKK
ncbi:MAG: hypothetical protein MSA65_04905 [Mollicutes bacterium]|nr:hypothetical protein [Mollicutes bacterium]MDD7591641.1 hypothetical protein [Bacilli bacterium]MDY5832338.1 hypothetical protein [Candidatus Onthovivens sp.]